MPKLFISYSRADIDAVKRIEQTLIQNGITVWRDQENLYGGQQWPKALGEAIASQDFLLLVWSKTSAKSHFVEFEWNTALALKKTIIPCLLDDTPLSLSLSAINGISFKNFDEALSLVLKALRITIPKTDPHQITGVIKKLEQITATEPKKVVKKAKSIFIQEGWNIQGGVYQAAGDIHVKITQPSIEETKKKSWLMKWQAWAVLLVALITLVTMLLELPEKISNLLNSTSDNTLVLQTLSGVIKDEDGKPLAGVVVILPEYELKDTTNSYGKYKFEVKATKQARVSLRVEKDNYEPIDADPTLGNTSCNFRMSRIKK